MSGHGEINDDRCSDKEMQYQIECASHLKSFSMIINHPYNYSFMPLQTRNIAKGIPPKVHLPKPTKPKPSAGKKDGTTKAALTKKNRKQHAS